MRLSGAIFDLDGVVLDTEGMYTKIWGAVGRKYHPEIEGFADMIKGMTLRNIMDKWFPGEELQREVDETLRRYEAEEMEFRYLNGADEYIRGLRERGIKTALATSSKREKIESVKRQIADIESLFDVVVTAEDVRRSKPDPEIFQKAAELIGKGAGECAVFEDSLNGLKAGRAAEMYVVGVVGTYSRAQVEALSDVTIDRMAELVGGNDIFKR
ncbi:MAG: HAD family phosphatase [Bacteroidales bacterium]|nr:HAD family phosphatase [Bacteroidales bacterium]